MPEHVRWDVQDAFGWVPGWIPRIEGPRDGGLGGTSASVWGGWQEGEHQAEGIRESLSTAQTEQFGKFQREDRTVQLVSHAGGVKISCYEADSW